MSLSSYVNKKRILFWLIGVFLVALLLDFWVTKSSFSLKEFIFRFLRLSAVGIIMVAFGIAGSYYRWKRWEDADWKKDEDKKEDGE